MVKMQGFTSHMFAAVMTLMVLTFPSPKDLWDRIAPQAAVEADAAVSGVPDLVLDPQSDTAVAMEDYLPVISACIGDSGPPMARSDTCWAEIAKKSASADGNRYHMTGEPNEVLSVAMLFYCRAQWTEAAREGRSFDSDNCLRS